jgi:ribonuclease VapC
VALDPNILVLPGVVLTAHRRLIKADLLQLPRGDIGTAAIIALLRDERGAAFCARAIADASKRNVSAINYVETVVVIDASGDPIASRRVDDFIKTAQIKFEVVTQIHGQIAREAYREFGKGSGHPAS